METFTKLVPGIVVDKIISGGQTGADQGGLEAGLALGLHTGGLIPKGFKTENGFDISLGIMFGLVEHPSDSYPPRTKLNIQNSDGTIIFGNPKSYGSMLTIKTCMATCRPFLTIEDLDNKHIPIFVEWLISNQIKTLNVAGNRESRSKGIQKFVTRFIIRSFRNGELR